MALTSGTLLGPYEILALAGAGGMGEVYKARDTRLDRVVAIKVLPPHFARREDLRLRFEREARIISSLNHPHICALFDVGVQDGANYLVMEYLEGETLDARLKRGPLSVEEALPLAIEIAEALAEAHRHNLIHRDLKPANVMLTRSGVKLLDFGLAKGLAASSSLAPDDATLTLALSAEGAFMGTLQYMPPEQLEGKDGDTRSDIFAFGCVIYEMVTGRRAFQGETQASVVGSIMTAEPDAIDSLQLAIPKALERLIRQCIRKKPDERLQSAHDIGLQLEWLRQPVEERAAPARRSRKKWYWAASALAAGGLVAAIALYPPPPREATPAKVEFDRAGATEISGVLVSPGGDSVAWREKNGIADTIRLRSLDTGATRVIAEGQGQVQAWSPDGRSLLYGDNGKLKRLDLAGGVVQDVCELGSRGFRAAWLMDGTILLGRNDGPLRRVSASGGIPVPFGQLDADRGERRQRDPTPLPDGRRVLYASTGRNPESSGIYIASLDGSAKPRRVHPAEGPFHYIHPNRLLIRHGEGMAVVRVDLDGEGKAPGEPLVIAPSVTSISASLDGKVIALVPGSLGADLVLMDRSGQKLADISPDAAGMATHPEFSPDGKRILFARAKAVPSPDEWVYDIVRRATARLTFSGRAGPGTWSGNGGRIFYYSGQGPDKRGGIYELSSDGAGAETLLAAVEAHHMHTSPDGRFLVYEKTTTPGGGDLWALPLTGDRKPEPLLAGRAYEHPRISPSSQLIAYSAAETGRSEVYLQTFPPGGGKWQVSTNGGTEPKWRADGKEILFSAEASIMSAAISLRGTVVEIGEVKELFRALRPRGGSPSYHFSSSPDGQFFVLGTIKEQDEPITLLLNWKLPAAR